MKNIVKIKCPAKINLTLEVVNKREDGFHNIKSIMQMISLYDYLTISLKESNENKILLSGTSNQIPYDEKNLVYKAVELYLSTAGIKNLCVDVYIEKNIPIAAGLAGGSTDAAGVIYGLNYLLKNFDSVGLNDLCAQLGSDLNVCLNGGCVLATSRGEVTQQLPVITSPVTLIKPKNLGISAGEAYKKYAAKEIKPQNNMTEKMIEALGSGADIKQYLYNDLEYAVFEDYEELQKIKRSYPEAVMSGSGSTFFILDKFESLSTGDNYLIFNDLHFVNHGVDLAESKVL
ncbi:MAG: 4-(cytidine 5'-diphospho)-2-C-methyl-D-erythritol kinase [Cyanobacteria bacterium SIG31]|nr:4-(cytidine 5'-diphospho)-2-C-methyl-D-erythritol kinase [Cyanobacteria bacterium SIG31]